jgi:uncharacterized sporulation protein YeaH/YhbH (DUF444 family)
VLQKDFARIQRMLDSFYFLWFYIFSALTIKKEGEMTISRTGDIQIDEEEYMSIIRGKIREDLKRYLGSGNVVIDTRDSGLISIAFDEIEIPTWRFGYPPSSGIGQGEGEIGEDLGPADAEGGEKGEGGLGHGRRRIVVDLTPEEFAHYFEEVLELPRIIPKGDRAIKEHREVWKTLSRRGPHSLIHLTRTIKEAIKRSIAEGTYLPPKKNLLVPSNQDLWFRSYDIVEEPKNNAVMFLMRDVSGSMGPAERRITSYLCDLCEFWLARNYTRLEKVYIVHDVIAQEVSREQFFTEDLGGGTMCSSALQKMHEIIDDRFPVSDWNIYPLYISDGFNFGGDNEKFIKIMRTRTLPAVNQFSYGQIGLSRSWWNSQAAAAGIFAAPGTLSEELKRHLNDFKNLSIAYLDASRLESAIDAIKSFFGKGN